MAWDEPFKSLTKNFTLNQKWNYARVSNPQYISPTFLHSFFPLVRKKFFFSRNGLTRPRSPTRGFWSTGSEMFPFQTAQNATKTQRYPILFFFLISASRSIEQIEKLCHIHFKTARRLSARTLKLLLFRLTKKFQNWELYAQLAANISLNPRK